MENPAVTHFREYLRINTVQPNPNYGEAAKWLESQAKEIGASCMVIECAAGKPCIVISIPGKDKLLPAICLNSHIDVVPVFPEHWKYEPFSAHKDDNGNIYARGSQDMKCVGVQYIEAMRELKKEGVELMRTVHMTFVPDEEIGGVDGMGLLVKTPEFKQLNIGFALDEGYASTSDEMFLFYGERSIWRVRVICPGEPGHASQFIEDNPGEKLRRIINSFLDFRDSEEKKLKENPSLTLGDVTTVNLTMIEGGVQENVIPQQLSVLFDIRITPTRDLAEFQKKIEFWCKEAGPGVYPQYEMKAKSTELSCVEDGKSAWWDAFSSACKAENITLKKQIFPAGTDGKYLRGNGIPVLGFSPMNNTPLLLHAHNEYLNEDIFLRGIEIYKTIIKNIANIEV